MSIQHPSTRRRLIAERGFTVIELLVVVALIGILASVGIGVTGNAVRVAKGQSGAQRIEGFLRRTREMAISRRRNIRIEFIDRSTVESRRLPVPGVPGDVETVLETVVLEGGAQFRQFDGVGDTPDLFGAVAEVTVGGESFETYDNVPVMFTSEGQFADANGFPINASIFLGVEGHVETANAVTVLGATAALRSYRWDGMRWVH